MSEVNNRDIVLGMMAVQLGIISKETLAAALRECHDDPDASLGDLFLQTGILNELNRDSLESEVDAHLDTHGESADSLAAVGLPADAIDAAGGIDQAALLATLDLPVGPPDPEDSAYFAGTVDPDQVVELSSPAAGVEIKSDYDEPTILPAGDDSESLKTLQQAGRDSSSDGSLKPGSLQRYRILRHHAEGGLGQVLLALDQEVNRQVAFKQIKPRFAGDTRSRARFLVEAEVTGRLEHPGVVPVYGLGAYADGRPFYAMRFIRGQSLRSAIRDFHAARKPGPDAEPQKAFDQSELTASDLQAAPQVELPDSRATTVIASASQSLGERLRLRSKPRQVQRRPLTGDVAFRSLIHRMIDVCNTMAYAHSKGVLHRDLKPANIMLGTYGETLIVDWGLAKVQGSRRTEDVSVDFDESLMEPVSGSQSAPTMLGSVIGTPMFMSPEQAEGRVDELGPGADIYSIGATLYELITGHSPVFGHETGSHLRLTDLLKRVRKGEFQPPRQVNPEVPRALEAICLKSMAHDPEDRYLSARDMAVDLEAWMADEPVSAWLEPWHDRLRRWISRHRMLVSSIAAAVTVGLIVSVIAFVLVSQSRDEERLARAEAVRRFGDARAAIDTSLTGISEGLKDLPELQARLLSQAADQYARLTRDHSDVPELQLETARALIRLGYVRLTLQEYPEARDAGADAVSLLEGLAAESSATLPAGTLQRELAGSHVLFALALQRLGETQPARTHFERSLAILEKLQEPPGSPGKASDRLAVGEARVRFAEALRETGDLVQAMGLLDEARQDFSAPAEDPLVDQSRQRGQGMALNSLCDVLLDSGRMVEASAHAEEAIGIWSELIEHDPDRPELYDGRATALVLLLAALDPITEESKRYEICLRAIEELETLTRALPDVPRFHYMLALARTNLAAILNQRGLNPVARGQAVESYRMLSDLLHRRYDRDTEAEAAAAQTMLARILTDMNDQELATAHFDEALAKYVALIDENPEIDGYREDRAVCLSNAARSLHQLGEHEAARRAFDEASAEFAAIAAAINARGESSPDWLLQSQAFVLTNLGDLLLENESADAASAAYKQVLQPGKVTTASHGVRLRLARFLCHCPDVSLRDPDRALKIATDVLAMTPVAAAWSVKGAAHVRLLEYDLAIEALETAREQRVWTSVSDDFLRAIAYWQRHEGNDRDTAIQLLEQSASLFQESQPGRREPKLLHREATTLIRLRP